MIRVNSIKAKEFVQPLLLSEVTQSFLLPSQMGSLWPRLPLGRSFRAVRHLIMPWMWVIHSQFSVVFPPGDCSSHHKQSCKQTSTEGGEDVSAKSRQGRSQRKKPKLTACVGLEVSKVEVWGGYGLLPWPSVYTETTPTRYAPSSETRFVKLQSDRGQFLQKGFGDSRLPRHFRPQAKPDTNSCVSDPCTWGWGFIMGWKEILS